MGHHEEHHDHGGRNQHKVDPFETKAAGYNESPLQRSVVEPLQRAVVSCLVERQPAPQKILDIGCGTGQLMLAVSEHFPQANLIGLDPSPKMLEVAREATAGKAAISYEEGNAEELPFEDGSFDTVITSLSFHHWEDHQKGLIEVRRVLKPGGLFILADTTYTHASKHNPAHHEHQFFSPDQLRGMFAAAKLGFDELVNAGGKDELQVIVAHAG